MRLKNDQGGRAIALRMGCGERLCLCQTRGLSDKATLQESTATPEKRKGIAEQKT
jgi:hypothetical protein